MPCRGRPRNIQNGTFWTFLFIPKKKKKFFFLCEPDFLCEINGMEFLFNVIFFVKLMVWSS